MRVRTAGVGVAVEARRFGTAVALATAAVFIAFVCFAGVAAALLSARFSPAVFAWVCVAAALPALARTADFFADAGFFAGAVFFAGLVFFAAGLLAAFFTVVALAVFLVAVALAGAAFCLTVVFFAAVFFAAVLRDAVFFAVDFLAGAVCVTFFLASGDLLDAFFLLAAAFGAAFFAEDFFAALATTNPSSLRCEIEFRQRIFRARSANRSATLIIFMSQRNAESTVAYGAHARGLALTPFGRCQCASIWISCWMAS